MDKHFRSYVAEECIVFYKTKEKFGELSNMSAGFLLHVNGFTIRTSEALYQICRFPDYPPIQERIAAQKSPMAAKMVGKPFRHLTRKDWNEVRVSIMHWCLKVKLIQNFRTFQPVLLATSSSPIVEFSRKDAFWGAKLNKDNGRLEGYNVLGRLLMGLREEIRNANESFSYVEPLSIEKFNIFGQKIEPIFVE